jgi:hypothetical protein
VAARMLVWPPSLQQLLTGRYTARSSRSVSQETRPVHLAVLAVPSCIVTQQTCCLSGSVLCYRSHIVTQQTCCLSGSARCASNALSHNKRVVYLAVLAAPSRIVTQQTCCLSGSARYAITHCHTTNVSFISQYSLCHHALSHIKRVVYLAVLAIPHRMPPNAVATNSLRLLCVLTKRAS